jgi:thiosulfate/3-mercaptopyruvate sulfurtransferase
MVFNTLVTPADLAGHLNDPGWVVFDCRHQLQDKSYGHKVYAESHIPGARFADVDTDLAAPIRPDTGRHPLPDLGAFGAWLGKQGVGPKTQVIAYDDKQSAFAARLWWMLHYAGHEAAAVLDGGFARWTAEGRPVTPEVPRPVPAEFKVRPNAAMLVDLSGVAAASASGSARIVDARAGERYRGEQEPIDPTPGHIPGAVNLPFSGNLNADGTFLPAGQLKSRFAPAVGSTPAASIHYCGSGVTACHNLLAMAAAGMMPGKLFVGSWSLWSKDPARPVATGPDPR